VTSHLYVDANVLIYMLDPASEWHPLAMRLVSSAADGRVALVTGDVAMSEVMVMPYRHGDPEIVREVRQLFEAPSPIRVIEHPRSVFDLAAQIRGRLGAGLVDALHLATAIEAGCDALISHDARMPRLPQMPVLRLDELELTP